MKTIIFSLLIFTFCGCYQSNDRNIETKSIDSLSNENVKDGSFSSQFLYHGNCSYTLSEPDGWLANPKPPQFSENIKIIVMYEPKDTIKHSSPIGISSNVIFKDDYNDITLNEFLNGEKNRAIENGEKVIEGTTIKTSDNKIAIVRKYFIENISAYYAIAYINEQDYIIMVTFSARDFNDHTNNYKYFEEIVQSYKYLGMTVIDETKK